MYVILRKSKNYYLFCFWTLYHLKCYIRLLHWCERACVLSKKQIFVHSSSPQWDGRWGTGMIFGTVSGGVVSPVPPFATLTIILALRCRPLGVDRMKGQTRTSIYSGSRQIVTAKRHSTYIILELQWQMPRLWNLSWTNGWLFILEVNTSKQVSERSEARASQLTFGWSCKCSSLRVNLVNIFTFVDII